jgi:hypothetical protein
VLVAAYLGATGDAMAPAGLDLAAACGAAGEYMVAAAVGAEIDDPSDRKRAPAVSAMGDETIAVRLRARTVQRLQGWQLRQNRWRLHG